MAGGNSGRKCSGRSNSRSKRLRSRPSCYHSPAVERFIGGLRDFATNGHAANGRRKRAGRPVSATDSRRTTTAQVREQVADFLVVERRQDVFGHEGEVRGSQLFDVDAFEHRPLVFRVEHGDRFGVGVGQESGQNPPVVQHDVVGPELGPDHRARVDHVRQEHAQVLAVGRREVEIGPIWFLRRRGDGRCGVPTKRL